jgi:hypothetical protein
MGFWRALELRGYPYLPGPMRSKSSHSEKHWKITKRK